MANRYFTILLVPEKTSKIKRIIVPAWILRGVIVCALFVGALAFMMVLDYWYVMDQINENKELKIQNRRLAQMMQIHKNKMESIEDTMDRIENFWTKLRVITNIEDRDNLVQMLNQELPDAATNVGREFAEADQTKETDKKFTSEEIARSLEPASVDPEIERFKLEQEELEQKFVSLDKKTLLTEQNLQDLAELLADQRDFLAALPTQKPAAGIFTSGFGIRRSPYGGREKMHEGLDIANYYGTKIVATANGTIRYAGRKPGYGRTVIIDHGYGLETWYGHNRKITVKPGQKVKRGQQIAQMGSTGRSTGPHVHYEVRVHGIPVDPLTYILSE